MYVHIGDYTTPGAIYKQVTVQYSSIGFLYWLRQENAKEMEQEWWNNAPRRRGQRARKRSHAPTAGISRGRIWQRTVNGNMPVMPPKGLPPMRTGGKPEKGGKVPRDRTTGGRTYHSKSTGVIQALTELTGRPI